MRWIAVSATAAVLLAGCSLGGDDGASSAFEDADFVVNLDDRETEESEEDLGAVALTRRGGRTLVEIEVENPRASSQQAEIRRGNCGTIDFAITYTLQAVGEGKSETVVNAPLDVLRNGYMVLVHDVPAEIRLSGICADLSRARPPDAVPVFE
jgi:hypothetical protein